MISDPAVIIGVVVAAFISALTVSLAFFRPMLRYIHDRLSRRHGEFSDRLCAGIWTSAVGASVISVVSMIRLTTGVFFVGLAIVAWVFIGGGYFLHFTAWRASMIGKHDGFAYRWAAVLVGIAAVAGLIVQVGFIR